MATIWQIFYSDAFEKEKERVLFIFLPEEGWFNQVCLTM